MANGLFIKKSNRFFFIQENILSVQKMRKISNNNKLERYIIDVKFVIGSKHYLIIESRFCLVYDLYIYERNLRTRI